MKSVQFRRERAAGWLELEGLVNRVEARGLSELLPSEVSRLPVLYRATLSSLSVARAISLDASLLSYLEGLASRAYIATYGTKRHPMETVREFFGSVFPKAAQSFSRPVALAAIMTTLGTVTGFMVTQRDTNRFYAFVSEGYAAGRGPSSTTDELRDVLYKKQSTADMLTAFAMFLFTHNAGVGMLAFATGFAAGVPTLLLLFSNGLTLGAFVALYVDRGLGIEFWAWLLPHGITEILAVILCGGAGLAIADALLFPGRHTRFENLAIKGREAGRLVLGAVAMFLLAGLIEGIFRQTVQSVPARLFVSVASAVGWAVYFRGGRE